MTNVLDTCTKLQKTVEHAYLRLYLSSQKKAQHHYIYSTLNAIIIIIEARFISEQPISVGNWITKKLSYKSSLPTAICIVIRTEQ